MLSGLGDGPQPWGPCTVSEFDVTTTTPYRKVTEREIAGLFHDNSSTESERMDLFGCSNTSHETGYLGTAVSREPEDGADFSTSPNTHRTIESPPFSTAQKMTSSSARNYILASTATLPPFPSDGRTSNYIKMQLSENQSSASFPQCSSTSSSIDSAGSAGSEHESGIICAWPLCKKVFTTMADYNHHCKTHTRPFQCSICLSRHATKRQVDRHINDCHDHRERYFCTAPACKRSMAGHEKPFTREDNCRKHMKRAHRFTDDQARICQMDELTRNIRMERKLGMRAGS
ncbi:hypothetical protein F5882DRAFT_39678 [Hyaloscypha sp. PMI_1271]|nr:hypothetical protein F5882DRAFT_39678 [Hyaloscypha sp. PMI_1271]